MTAREILKDAIARQRPLHVSEAALLALDAAVEECDPNTWNGYGERYAVGEIRDRIRALRAELAKEE
jgi:hypothetical protein